MNQLVKEVNVKQEYQAIVFGEMKIKEGLVYDKNECRIIGFIDLGPVNNAFASFERTLDESGGHTAPIAKQILQTLRFFPAEGAWLRQTMCLYGGMICKGPSGKGWICKGLLLLRYGGV